MMEGSERAVLDESWHLSEDDQNARVNLWVGLWEKITPGRGWAGTKAPGSLAVREERLLWLVLG